MREEFKKKIVRLHLEDGQSLKSLANEYGVSKSDISYYGLRWLLRRFRICPNAYYNYLKNRNAEYYKQKKKIKDTITHLYHKNHGILGYRQMKKFLEREGVHISCTTCHKYMNTELKL